MMKNREEIVRECARLCVEYVEAYTKHGELLSQIFLADKVEPGKRIPSKPAPDLVSNKEYQESDQKVQDARKRWHECYDQLREA